MEGVHHAGRQRAEESISQTSTMHQQYPYCAGPPSTWDTSVNMVPQKQERVNEEGHGGKASLCDLSQGGRACMQENLAPGYIYYTHVGEKALMWEASTSLVACRADSTTQLPFCSCRGSLLGASSTGIQQHPDPVYCSWQALCEAQGAVPVPAVMSDSAVCSRAGRSGLAETRGRERSRGDTSPSAAPKRQRRPAGERGRGATGSRHSDKPTEGNKRYHEVAEHTVRKGGVAVAKGGIKQEERRREP
ncbi:hypothetical protein NDU88_000995 [Pleurodeles waltl]|uniref:Uncharacterized protein n=1 Tax=Pleurodeles waltl TaxID=8319 RepID=A0AAV7LA18_PLEWA|nr:hypothetical protein NDU88_000995 [Pleurodeles waltl]